MRRMPALEASSTTAFDASSGGGAPPAGGTEPRGAPPPPPVPCSGGAAGRGAPGPPWRPAPRASDEPMRASRGVDALAAVLEAERRQVHDEVMLVRERQANLRDLGSRLERG